MDRIASEVIGRYHVFAFKQVMRSARSCRVSCWSPQAGVVEFGLDGVEAGFDVAEAFAEGELGEREGEELIAAGEPTGPGVAAVASDAGVEFVAWKELHELEKPTGR